MKNWLILLGYVVIFSIVNSMVDTALGTKVSGPSIGRIVHVVMLLTMGAGLYVLEKYLGIL